MSMADNIAAGVADAADFMRQGENSVRDYLKRTVPVWEWPKNNVQAGSIYANPTPNPLLNPDAQATESMTASVFASKYGYAAAFLDHPEVGPILKNAAANGWGEAELYGAISQTGWWKSSSDNARSWEMLVNEDPATANRVAAEVAANIQNRARTLGIQLSPDQIASMARSAAQHGWTESQVIDRLIGQANWSSLSGGDLTAMRDDVKAKAGEYLVNVSDATAQKYAARMASGELTLQGVESIMQKQAKARFSWMSSEIDQGITPSMYMDPIRQTIASELEIAPEGVNLMDGKWMGMVEVEGEDGQLRAASQREAQLAARKDERWKSTSKAQDATARTIQFVQQAMGRRAI